MKTTAPLKLVIVEDDAVTRDAVTMLLSGEPELQIVAAHANGRSLIDAFDDADFDVALVDLGLPDIDGIDLIAAIKARRPTSEVMAYTVSESRDRVFAALAAGATGYVLKGCRPAELIEAIFTLAQGGAPMSPTIARSVVRAFQGSQSISEDYLLTSRERDVLSLLEQGMSYKEVAAALSVSPHTVHSHIKKIYEKLHASGRDEALRVARLKGLI
ncbi:MAG TPA: response regulator transcription factor [Polyangiaceae bacterium]|nr:response regulator transcription factor [Polyangiaceae bacterium]